jgi:hypothetical protein
MRAAGKRMRLNARHSSLSHANTPEQRQEEREFIERKTTGDWSDERVPPPSELIRMRKSADADERQEGLRGQKFIYNKLKRRALYHEALVQSRHKHLNSQDPTPPPPQNGHSR